jgi:hypothetical protein
MSALKLLIKDYKLYFNKCLKIRNKDAQVVPFQTNEAQDRLLKIINDWKASEPDETKRPTLYIIILKARQLGFSTATEGVFFHDLNFSFNKVAMIVSFDEDSAVTINDMADRFYKYMPHMIKPKRRPSRGKGILFENPRFDDSKPISKENDPGLQNKFLVETAKNLNAGSSYTINYLHISELAKWDKPQDTMTSIMQSVPDFGAVVIVESTAKGMNYFQELWDNSERRKNNFVALFVAWFENKLYRAPYTGFEISKYEQQIKETYNLDNEQLQWRRNTIKDKLNGDENLFKQEYPCCAEEAFLTTGTPVFANELVIARKRLLEKKYEAQKPLRGLFTYEYKQEQIVDSSIKFIEDDNGPFILYESVDKRTPYVIGGDTAEGGADYSLGQVLNNLTGKQTATWRMHTDSDLYAKQMYCLGKFFNDALIAIETNFDLHPVKELQRLGYYRQFRRETIDQITEERRDVFGFVTTRVTRPVIIDELVSIVRESIELINDIETLNEMLVFIRNEKGRAEAMEGKHDDCIMALAIAYNARSQQSMSPIDDEERESEYTTGFGRTGY